MTDRTPEQDFTDWFTGKASASTLGATRAPAQPVTDPHAPGPRSNPEADPSQAFADYLSSALGITQPEPTTTGNEIH
ncbi:hypothetical protein NOCA2210008 [metagenome]|uniref:Uncharacterized protein n=1 Tax=metagenome TaxID=256318 RepID=A0A2P2BY29_9ZZZZ